MTVQRIIGGFASALLAGAVSLGLVGWMSSMPLDPSSGAGQERGRPSGDPTGPRARSQPDTWKGGAIRPFRTVVDREGARALSLAARADRRAYDGAPPVMPHSAIFGDGTKTCLDCHTDGMTLGERVAHPMSHPPYGQCLQCHVESSNRQFPPRASQPNGFAGLKSPGPGTRQSTEAPPQVPHEIAMRGQCLSCHGEFGYPGIRTTHPQRANCVQCHVVQRVGR